MRNSRNNLIVKDDNGTITGISLGADYCAEHEWGIAGLNRLFGIKKYEKHDATDVGVARRTITQVPGDNLAFIKRKGKSGFTALIVCPYARETEEVRNMTMKQLKSRFLFADPSMSKSKIATAWDEGSLLILAEDTEAQAAIEEVYNSMTKKDLLVMLGGGGPFENAGLVLGIVSRLSEETKENMVQADVKSANLWKEANDTGIFDVLKDANKRYFALSPAYDKDGNLIFWLNPCDQTNNNSGGFKVEDLKQWVENKGPIPKEKK